MLSNGLSFLVFNQLGVGKEHWTEESASRIQVTGHRQEDCGVGTSSGTELVNTQRQAENMRTRISTLARLVVLVCCFLSLLVSAKVDQRFLVPSSRILPTPFYKVIRGGSSPFQPRTPPSVKGRPGQQYTQTTPQTAFGGTPGEKDRLDDDVSTREMIDAFLTRDSRNSFIARVYSILAVQLVVTAISCFLFGLNPTLSSISQMSRNGLPSPLASIPIISLLFSTLAWFRVCSSPEARRKSPNKWWWLSIFTLGEAISVGFLSSFYQFRSVVTAMGATAVATIAVSIYTILQTNPNRDLSQVGASLSSWAVILLSYLIVGLCQESGILPKGFIPYNEMLYSGFAACLFSAFLAYHTKLIVAGKHSKYRMNEKDYVYGAMALYSDVINIFLNLLSMIGEDRDK